MSKLNKKVTSPSVSTSKAPFGKALSGNGNLQAIKAPEQILFEILVSAIYGQDTFYDSASAIKTNMRSAINSVLTLHGVAGARYILRAAKFAREQMNMRTMPVVMIVETAKAVRDIALKLPEVNEAIAILVSAVDNRQQLSFAGMGNIARELALTGAAKINKARLSKKKLPTEDELMSSVLSTLGTIIPFRSAVANTIGRVDELTDMYSYALTIFKDKGSVPISLKKGIADAFNKFDAYQFGKYNRDDGLKLKDLLRIVHPKPADAVHSEIFQKIMTESLESPHTWEVVLSRNGQLPSGERKTPAALWEDLINTTGSGSLGYMALIRNLRNMKEAGISADAWREVARRISDPKAVQKSKQLPFRFMTAYQVAKDNDVPNLVLNALSDAADLSLSNMPKMGDNVWIILDGSGSMGTGTSSSFGRGSSRSKFVESPIVTGAMFSAALIKASKNSFNVKLTMFDDKAYGIQVNPNDSIFTIYEKIMNRRAGGGTNLQSALAQKPALGFEPDTVVLLSDMQVNAFNNPYSYSYSYGSREPLNSNIFKKDTVKVAVNLNSGTTTPVSEWEGWIQLSGWSEKIFQFVEFKKNATSIVNQLFTSAGDE